MLLDLLGINKVIKQIKCQLQKLESNSGGNFIPLPGTEEGKPASGSIKYKKEGYLIVNEPDNYQSSIGFDSDGTYLGHSYNNEPATGYQFVSSSLGLTHYLPFGNNNIIAGIEVQTSMDSELGIGIYSMDDFSAITSGYEELDGKIFAQRNFVTKQISNFNSYSIDETLTGGTWIDGKPIYRKVLIIDNTDEHEIGSYINLDNYITDLDFVLPNQIYLDDNGGILMGNGRLVIFNGKYINFFTDVTGTIDNPVPIGIMTIILEYTKTTD